MRKSTLDNGVVGIKNAFTRKHKPDHKIIMYMGVLMMLGLVVIYAIGPQRANVLNNAYGADYSDSYFFIKQLASLALALVSFTLMSIIPFTFFQKHSKAILISGFIASGVLVLFGNIFHFDQIVQCSLGACRWISLGPFGTFQPAELLKFGMLVFVAGFLGIRVNQGLLNDVNKTLIPLAILLITAIIFVIGLQKDMGTGMVIIAIVASMLMVAGIKKRYGAIMIAGVVLLGLGLIIIAPHRIERITTFLAGDSSSVTDSGDYHIVHAKIAIGSGGIIGVGIGNSVQATGYLPEAINDSVFAIMGETFGFIGLVIIIILFTALLMRILRVADYLPDMRMKLIAVGSFSWLGAHVILNIAAMIGVFPLTGITLPLLSFGGTSMIFIAGILGLTFQLSRYTSHSLNIKESSHETNPGSWRRVGRTRNASHRRNLRNTKAQ